MRSTVAFYKGTVVFQVTFWAWSPEWDLLPAAKPEPKGRVSVDHLSC